MTSHYRNDQTVLLSGGVGGARMARGLAGVLDPPSLTIVVNVGDDAEMYGLHVAADLDTVLYTLAGIEGPEGWGIRDDTFRVLDALAALGIDTTFRLGDRDMGTCLARSTRLAAGASLSAATGEIARSLGVATTVLPATDDRARTRVRVGGAGWLDFQEYFVLRRHRDPVEELDYAGAGDATPAPGVLEAISSAHRVIIAPSNPPLSVWPMLAIPGIRRAIADHPKVIAVSPLIGGRALKGPAAEVMAALGLPPGNAGVAQAYAGLLTDLVIHSSDADEAASLGDAGRVVVTNTRITARHAAERLATELLEL